MSQPETARELIGKARSYRCSDQPCRCPACELARRVERALALHREAHGDCSLCWETWPCATRRALDWLE